MQAMGAQVDPDREGDSLQHGAPQDVATPDYTDGKPIARIVRLP